MNAKEFQNACLSVLSELSRKVSRLDSQQEKIMQRLDTIRPQIHGMRLPKPPQSVLGRDPNPARTFRKLIEEENAKLSEDDHNRLRTFPVGWTDEQINAEARRFVEMYMNLELKEGLRGLTWTDIAQKDPKGAERVIRRASLEPELSIFSQSCGLWGARMIAMQKQKAMKRSAHARKNRKPVSRNQNKKSNDVRYRTENPGDFNAPNFSCTNHTTKVYGAVRSENDSGKNWELSAIENEQVFPFTKYIQEKTNCSASFRSKYDNNHVSTAIGNEFKQRLHMGNPNIVVGAYEQEIQVARRKGEKVGRVMLSKDTEESEASTEEISQKSTSILDIESIPRVNPVNLRRHVSSRDTPIRSAEENHEQRNPCVLPPVRCMNQMAPAYVPNFSSLATKESFNHQHVERPVVRAEHSLSQLVLRKKSMAASHVEEGEGQDLNQVGDTEFEAMVVQGNESGKNSPIGSHEESKQPNQSVAHLEEDEGQDVNQESLTPKIRRAEIERMTFQRRESGKGSLPIEPHEEDNHLNLNGEKKSFTSAEFEKWRSLIPDEVIAHILQSRVSILNSSMLHKSTEVNMNRSAVLGSSAEQGNIQNVPMKELHTLRSVTPGVRNANHQRTAKKGMGMIRKNNAPRSGLTRAHGVRNAGKRKCAK